jgi:hypothetical protein
MKTEAQEIQEFFDSLRKLKGVKITYNPEIDKNNDVIYFPEKVRKAKEHLAKVGIPKAYYEQMAKKNKEKEK